MNNRQCNIAVVGMGGLFPGSKNIEEYWENIVSKHVFIKPLPERYLREKIFYRPELLNARNKHDKTITKMCGLIDDFKFDVTKFKIPPAIAAHMSDNQHVSLYTADQALNSNILKGVDNKKIAVIMGNSMFSENHMAILQRLYFQIVSDFLINNHTVTQKIPKTEVEKILQDLFDATLTDSKPITEDSAPGILINIAAGRIANAFDFHGPAYVAEGACASGLTAVTNGILGLNSGDYDAVVCGASDMVVQVDGLIMFSALNALSPDGSFPFDKRANGFIIGQGGGTVILKRLEDAIAHNDPIYAVIKGYGQHNDGKGKYIAAPNAKWQAETIKAAYETAGFSIDTVELIEAHGTGTIAGDQTEVKALKQSFAELGCTRKNYCGLGSVKSNIGHLKSAAGMAGLIKAVLGLHHKILPPTANFKDLNPKLGIEDSPFYILEDPKEWKASDTHPRRAGVSSFGFGGSNWHLALEEYVPGTYKSEKKYFHVSHTDETPVVDIASEAGIATAFFFSADTIKALKKEAYALVPTLETGEDVAAAAFNHNYNADVALKCRLAVTALSPDDLKEKLDTFFDLSSKQRNAKNTLNALKAKGIFYKEGTGYTKNQIALMFPGQGSQYPGMLKELTDHYPVMRRYYAQADALWAKTHGKTISNTIFNNTDHEDAENILKQTDHAQPAIFVSSLALYGLLTEMGLKADYMIGHSLGEISALSAGRRLSFKQGLKTVAARVGAFMEADITDPGAMLALPVSMDEAKRLIEESALTVYIANINAPDQIIISGGSEQTASFEAFLSQKKISYKRLDVSHAFHSPLIEAAAVLYEKKIATLKGAFAHTKICACHIPGYYPEDSKVIPELLVEQLKQPVHFSESLNSLYNEGVRLFIEVGPGNVLSGLAHKTLTQDDVTVLSSDIRRGNSVSAFQKLLAGLFVNGVELELIPPSLTGEQPQKVSAGKGDTRSAHDVKVAGVSVGLPGSYKNSFRDDNFEQLFEGKNLIEHLTMEEREKLAGLNITRLIKTETGATFKVLSSINEVIQVASKQGKIDLLKDYCLDEKLIMNMSTSISHAVAAGYEALRDAGIPLIHEYIKTKSNALLPSKWSLPKEMQRETGVIFANGFPMIDPFIKEVSRYFSYVYGSKARKDLMSFYEDIISRISDTNAKKILTDWYTKNYAGLSTHPGEEEVYMFNYNLLNQIAVQANSRLATLINARGPNFLLLAACSSTSVSITLAEEMIRSGRIKRMIIIGSDMPVTEETLPWLGGGFLSTGTATTESNIYDAALPFDKRRNGLILGSGSVGLVIEESSQLEKRGMNGLCKILGTHVFNAADHPSQISTTAHTEELERFITRIENDYTLNRDALAEDMIYISHETYTPPRGGCAQSEAFSLKSVFKDRVSHILIGNTKGLTGHTMGASIEDALAAKALQHKKIPPVANFKQEDPEIAGLTLSKGGTHNRNYALRMSAGFGAHGTYALFKKEADGDTRIIDKKRYNQWLKNISGDDKPELALLGRMLVIKDALFDKHDQERQKKAVQTVSSEAPKPVVQMPAPETAVPAPSEDIETIVREIFSEITGYPVEMLDGDMEMEADLGIDTVKQATVISILGERFDMGQDIDIQLSNYRTIGSIIEFVKSFGPQTPVGGTQPATTTEQTQPVEKRRIRATDSDLKTVVREIFSEITGYPVEMLDEDMEMEADLGIDTVKQATVVSILGERFGMGQDIDIQLSNYRTIGDIIQFVKSFVKTSQPVDKKEQPASQAVSHTPKSMLRATDSDLETVVREIFSEITGYPVEMLDADMEMEADLGIDTVKQATVVSILGERFGIGQDIDIQLSNYRTIGDIITFMKSFDITPAQEVDKKPIIEQEEVVESDDLLETTTLSRQIPILVKQKAGEKKYTVQNKTVWVLGSNKKIIEEIANGLTQKKAKVHTFIIRDNPDSHEVIESFKAFSKNHSPQVVIDCTHIGKKIDFMKSNKRDVVKQLIISSEIRFAMYKFWGEYLKKPEKIICLTAIDGYLGYDDKNMKVKDPIYGSLLGFYKALRKEWPETTLSCLDFSPRQITDANRSELRKKIITEIECNINEVEVAYHGNTRKVVKLRNIPLVEEAADLDLNNKVLVITGGASGITRKIVLELARLYSIKFVIIGKTHFPDDILQLVQLDEAGLKQLKHDIHTQLKYDHKRVTPVMVEKEYKKVVKAISTYKTIQEIQGLGRKAAYYAGDIADYDTLSRILDKARSLFGPINGVIHAAGVEISHLMAKKSLEEFRTVFNVKAMGALNISLLCNDDPLEIMVAFSSISGRFGNAAQLDYSAANSFLNYWIKCIKSTRAIPHALALVWSAWKDTGMAWENEIVRTTSENAGINFIEPDVGIEAFLQEIQSTKPYTEIILHKGLGPLTEHGTAIPDLMETPLIDRIILNPDESIRMIYKRFTVTRDPIIGQHRLGDTPILPGIASMELCLEYYSLLEKNRTHYLLKNVTFHNPFKLFHNRSAELYVQATPTDNGEGVQFEVRSHFVGKIAGASKDVLHHTMKIMNRDPDITGLDPAGWQLHNKPFQTILMKNYFTDIHQGVSPVMNLGPLFNGDLLITEGDNVEKMHYNEHGSIRIVNFPEEHFTNPHYYLRCFIINPCFFDFIYQAGAMYCVSTMGRVYLPYEVEEIGILKVPRERGVYTITAGLLEKKDDLARFNAVIQDQDGTICYFARNLLLKRVSR